MRLLVVEDDRRLAAVVRRGLSEAGHVVDVEYDGLDGEASANTVDCDVIVLDVNLPGKDGFAVVRAISGIRNGDTDSDADLTRHRLGYNCWT